MCLHTVPKARFCPGDEKKSNKKIKVLAFFVIETCSIRNMYAHRHKGYLFPWDDGLTNEVATEAQFQGC